jgi:hypothetical protein
MRRLLAIGLAAFLMPAFGSASAQTEPARQTTPTEPPRQEPQKRRASPPQRQVERSVAYFVGRWRFDYVGAEFPPLSPGGRTGTATFSRLAASNFLAGDVEGETAGKPYRENWSMGFDPETNTLALVERRSDGAELVSLGHWRSPLAITWQTAPVQADGKAYQLKRVISITSDMAFEMVEEFSLDGGPFRRLGRGVYTKQP